MFNVTHSEWLESLICPLRHFFLVFSLMFDFNAHFNLNWWQWSCLLAYSCEFLCLFIFLQEIIFNSLLKEHKRFLFICVRHQIDANIIHFILFLIKLVKSVDVVSFNVRIDTEKSWQTQKKNISFFRKLYTCLWWFACDLFLLPVRCRTAVRSTVKPIR